MTEILIKLTGLWEHTRRGNPGNTYWVGRLGAAKILVFKNNRKEDPDDPDFNIFLTEPSPPRQERTGAPRQTDPGAGVLAGAGRSLLATEPLPEGGDPIDAL